MQRIIAALALISILFIGIIHADIPVHCLKDQVLGKWKMTLSKQNKNAKDAMSQCEQKSTFDTDKTINLQLSEPNVVTNIDTQSTGTWTLIYDEGYEIRVDDLRFFAFFQYEKSWSGKVTSYCNMTFTGVFHENSLPRPSNFGCFRGVQTQNSLGQSPLTEYQLDHDSTQRINQQVFENHQDYIDELNRVQTSWKAGPYKQFEGLSMKQIVAKGGNLKINPFKARANKRYMATERSKLFYRAKDALLKQADPLPTSFDWRNVSGIDYTSKTRDQRSCGSCYIYATTGIIQDRIQIATKNQKKPVLSTQSQVDCAKPIFAQGCEGGFVLPIAHNIGIFGIPEESEYPYYGRDGQCKDIKGANPYYARDYNYVGQYYGGCSEQEMMKTVATRGPITVGIEVYSDFFHYHGGIYKHTKTSLDDKYFNGWEEINHAVVVVGWGESSRGEKYWIVRNSWSSSWGIEGGYVLIERGTDCIGIESNAAEVIVDM